MSEITCIIYLEPNKNSELYQNIENFYQESIAKYGPNEATKYHPHVSMTGFFTLRNFIPSSEHSKDNKSVIAINQQLDSIINFITNFLEIHIIMANHENAKMNNNNDKHLSTKTNLVEIQGIIRPKNLSKSLLISLSTNKILHNLIKELVNKDNLLLSSRIKSKNLDHISLIYFKNDNNIVDGTSDEIMMTEIETLAKKLIDINIVKDKDHWNIILYEKVFHAKNLDEKHLFREIKKWEISSKI